MMKVVKTDSIVPVSERYTSVFDGMNIEFVQIPCDTEDDLIRACADADGMLILKEPVTARVIASLSRCKVISRFGAGVDTIDVAAAEAAGIAVRNVTDGSVEEVSTHAVAMILALVRRLPRFDRSVRDGFYDAMREGAGMRRTSEMTVGMVGLGRIGAMTAQKLAPFRFRIWAYDPYASDEQMRAAGAERRDLGDIVAGSDVISVHTPLTSETTNIIDGKRLKAMKPGAMIVNVSRGGLIDEAILADLLVAGRIGGAGLDVFADEPLSMDSPLRRTPNTLLSPHAAFCSREALDDVVSKAFQNVATVLSGSG